MKRPKRKRGWFRWTMTVLTGLLSVLWITSIWYEFGFQIGSHSPKNGYSFSNGLEVVYLVRAFGLEMRFGELTMRYSETIRGPIRRIFLFKRLLGWRYWSERVGLRSAPHIETDGRVFVQVPVWMIWIVPAAITLWLWRAVWKRREPGHCRSCNYSLTGNISGRCPECGTPIEPQTLEQLSTLPPEK